jgi:hypothetical protein
MSDLELQLATAQQELKAVYRERDHLIATLCAFLPATITPSVHPDWSLLGMQVDEDATLFWSIAAENRDLFPHVAAATGVVETDGRSTDEKYAALREITAAMVEVVTELNTAGLSDLMAALSDAAPEPEPEPAPEPEPMPEPEPEHEAEPVPAARPRKATARKTTAAKKAGA